MIDGRAGRIADRAFKLIPAAALLPALFVFDDGLRWIGVLGLIPLVMAFQPGCPACALRRNRNTPGWTPFAGH